jgi:RNA-directed DNA polymerase
VNAGDLWAKDVRETKRPTEVRAAIVASKPGNAGGAKGGRKANSQAQGNREEPSPKVPETDKQGEDALKQRFGAEREVWSEGMLLALERGVKGNRWFSLIDKVYGERTLKLAWEKVSANAGACGVDGITTEHFAKDSQKRLLAVKERLMEDSYKPQAVKRVWIPKLGSSERRPLGIPTVRDRVVQTALKMVIEPIFEREFAEHSYGFRPGRNCHDALRRVDSLLRDGHVHVVDIDIKGYFDTIPRKKLLEMVSQRIADGRVLRLIEAFLRQEIEEGNERFATEAGTPQGGVISPLLANVYLNPLDWLMSSLGFEMIRYADDMVVLCKDAQSSQQAHERVREWMEQAGLQLHETKTRLVDLSQTGKWFDFLGYRFYRSKKGGLLRLVREKSRKKLRENLKPLTRRTCGRSLADVVGRINPILRGWYGYFKQAHAMALEDIDQWVRSRLRTILRKRCNRRGRGRGKDHQRWRNSYFDRLGLFCLARARESELSNLRNGVKC